MKKRRLLFFFTISVLIFLIIFFSSSIFVLKNIELNLFEKREDNSFYLASCNENGYNLKGLQSSIGKSIFYIKENNLIKSFEEDNPCYRVLEIEYKFPNVMSLKLIKRQSLFYIMGKFNTFILDEDFKIVKIEKPSYINVNNLIEILTGNNNNIKNYFAFFNIDESCYYEGYFLYKHNLLINCIKNFSGILVDSGKTAQNFKSIMLNESNNLVDLVCSTNANYGIKIIVENIESNFNKKFQKILSAFLTLCNKDKIKTTYGKLVIDDNLNCKFYED